MVTIYTKPGCGKCSVLKEKMREKGIEYQENSDVDLHRSIGLKSYPVLDIQGKKMYYLNAINWVNNWNSVDQ